MEDEKGITKIELPYKFQFGHILRVASIMADSTNIPLKQIVIFGCLLHAGYAQDLPSPYVRLVGGRDPYEGRVEIYANGEWGTVCDDLWDDNDARVVCNMLRIRGRALAVANIHFGHGSGMIHLDNVMCVGNEDSIFACGNSGLGNHNCNHLEDAGIICGIDGPPSPIVRLVNGPIYGRVEIYVSGIWGTVCDDGWDDNDAKVVCNMLGISGRAQAVKEAQYGQGYGLIHLDEVRCFGNENSLLLCGNVGLGNHDCDHSEDAGVICGYGPPSPIVRLVDGTSSEGRVEIYISGIWGTVCDDQWDDNDARVVCNMLGISGQAKGVAKAYYGQGYGLIHMDNVRCTGNEDSLLMCSYIGSQQENCDHSADAGVACGIDGPRSRILGSSASPTSILALTTTNTSTTPASTTISSSTSTSLTVTTERSTTAYLIATVQEFIINPHLQATSTTPSVSQTSKPERPGNQWQYSKEAKRCYHLQTSSNPISWDEAEKRCKAINAHLASPSTKVQHDVVVDLTRQADLSDTDVWIGLFHDNGASGQDQHQLRQGWKWLDGSPYSFEAWSPEEPEEGERYARLKQGKWYGTGGSYSLFLCQKEPASLISEESSICVDKNTEPNAGMNYKFAFLALLVIPVLLAVVVATVYSKRKHGKKDNGENDENEQYCEIDELDSRPSPSSETHVYYNETNFHEKPALKKSRHMGVPVLPNDIQNQTQAGVISNENKSPDSHIYTNLQKSNKAT